jgi:hypothetical protein
MSLQVPVIGQKPLPKTPNASPVQPTRTIAETAKAIAPYKVRLRHYKVIVDSSIVPAKVTVISKDAIPGKK